MAKVLLYSRGDIFTNALHNMLARDSFSEVTVCDTEQTAQLNDNHKADFDIALINAKSLQYPLDKFFQQFYAWNSDIKILVFGVDNNDDFVRNLIREGAHGFIDDETQEHELKSAIRGVINGHLWISRDLLDRIALDAFEIERMIENSIKERISILSEQLSAKENDIFLLLLDGLSTKEMAAQLHLSEQSVKLYLNRLFRKFDVKNRSQLILIAFERVCPVQNMIKLFRVTLDRRRARRGKPPAIVDPLED